VKHGGGREQPRGRPAAITELEGDHVLRLEAFVAGKDHGRGGLPQIAVDARWHANGPGDRGPENMRRRYLPLRPHVRLVFETGVVVVLDLRAERERPAASQPDLALHEGAVEFMVDPV